MVVKVVQTLVLPRSYPGGADDPAFYVGLERTINEHIRHGWGIMNVWIHPAPDAPDWSTIIFRRLQASDLPEGDTRRERIEAETVSP